MKKVLLICSLLFSLVVKAQFISPLEGDFLNYTDILFEVEQVQQSTKYIFKFWECNKRGEKCKELKQIKSKHRALVVNSLFDFDKTYKWSFGAYKGKKLLYQSREIVFQTGNSALLDSNLQRWEWKVKNTKRKNGIIIIDGLKLALNMAGKPVFYLNYQFDHTIRDINITKQGTITLVDNRLGEIKEVSLKGEMLWLGPERNGAEFQEGDKFHHEFEKINDSLYLVAGKRRLKNIETEFDFSGISGQTICETILAFDNEKNEIWRFNLLPELKRQFNITPTSQMFNSERLGHLNGLAYDEKNKYVYASFKTFSSVFKIEKETNNILYLYGNKKIDFSDSLQSSTLFEQQHCPVFMPNGNLLILNNGNETTGSGIVELNTKPNLNPENELVKSIFFKNILGKDFYTSQMGSVQFIDKNNVLVGMGNAGHLFELNTKKKKVNWQIYTFQNTKWNEKRYVWKPQINYRVNYYSSLYPYYFIVNKMEKKSNLYLQIVNIGSETEDYILSIFDKNNILLEKRILACKGQITVKLSAYDKENILVICGVKSGRKAQISM